MLRFKVIHERNSGSLVMNAPHMALVGKIDNNPGFFVGSDFSEILGIAGILFLGVNDQIFGDNLGSFTATITTSPVPEPATMLLLGSGLAGLAGLRRKLRRS